MDFIKILEEYYLENINMINFIKNYGYNYIHIEGNSVLIKGISDREWIYIKSNSEIEFRKLLSNLNENDRNFAIIKDWMIPILSENRTIKWKMTSQKLILDDSIEIVSDNSEIEQLNCEDAEFLYNNSDYKDILTLDYVADRIKNGINGCIKVDNKPVAWVMTQDDGAIGFLHVLPDYRKLGYAKKLTRFIINEIRKNGDIPFLHIEEENTASMKNAENLGFKFFENVSWIEFN